MSAKPKVNGCPSTRTTRMSVTCIPQVRPFISPSRLMRFP